MRYHTIGTIYAVYPGAGKKEKVHLVSIKDKLYIKYKDVRAWRDRYNEETNYSKIVPLESTRYPRMFFGLCNSWKIAKHDVPQEYLDKIELLLGAISL